MKDFQGKVAVVTGGAEGIGRAIAEEAAARGMKIVLADIDGARLDAAIADFAARGVESEGLRIDVSVPAQVDRLADAAFARFGAVHLLVNNAGVAHGKAAWDTTPDEWAWVMGVNFYGVTNGLRAFLPRMIASGEEGHVVSTASMAGLLSLPSMAAYNASKHAVVTVMEGLHHDLKLRGARIGASVLCPSWVKTRITQPERHQAPGVDAGTLDPVAAKIAATVRKAVAAGIEPGEAARAVFRAVVEERFYILTHADSKAGVKARLEDILQDRVPTLMRM